MFNDINDLSKTNVNFFQELMLILLDKMPNEIRMTYISKIRPYIEDMKEHDFTNINFPRFYKYLNKSEIESLEYLLQKAGDLSTEQFDLLLTNINIRDLLKTLTQNQKVFMDFERRLWEMLDDAEMKKGTEEHEEKERYNSAYKNIEDLVNKFIQTTS